jgi:hypothetical protein
MAFGRPPAELLSEHPLQIRDSQGTAVLGCGGSWYSEAGARYDLQVCCLISRAGP